MPSRPSPTRSHGCTTSSAEARACTQKHGASSARKRKPTEKEARTRAGCHASAPPRQRAPVGRHAFAHTYLPMDNLGAKNVLSSAQEYLDPQTQDFYRAAMLALRAAHVDFLVGGAYAFARYTGIARHTKDFDIFVRESHIEHVLDVLATTGSRTEVTFPHWLGKAIKDSD